jgi:hypothetical protein
MSIHDKTQSIWEELVRMREVMALDSYARQLAQAQEKMGKLDFDKIPTEKLKERIDRDMALAQELDRVRTEMKRRAFPLEHV